MRILAMTFALALAGACGGSDKKADEPVPVDEAIEGEVPEGPVEDDTLERPDEDEVDEADPIEDLEPDQYP